MNSILNFHLNYKKCVPEHGLKHFTVKLLIITKFTVLY